jgi:hypothetical protein
MFKITLFRWEEIWPQAIEFARRLCGQEELRRAEIPAVFPVYFPVSREFGVETGSIQTASSASQSGLSRLPLECSQEGGLLAFGESLCVPNLIIPYPLHRNSPRIFDIVPVFWR